MILIQLSCGCMFFYYYDKDNMLTCEAMSCDPADNKFEEIDSAFSTLRQVREHWKIRGFMATIIMDEE